MQEVWTKLTSWHYLQDQAAAFWQWLQHGGDVTLLRFAAPLVIILLAVRLMRLYGRLAKTQRELKGYKELLDARAAEDVRGFVSCGGCGVDDDDEPGWADLVGFYDRALVQVINHSKSALEAVAKVHNQALDGYNGLVAKMVDAWPEMPDHITCEHEHYNHQGEKPATQA